MTRRRAMHARCDPLDAQTNYFPGRQTNYAYRQAGAALRQFPKYCAVLSQDATRLRGPQCRVEIHAGWARAMRPESKPRLAIPTDVLFPGAIFSQEQEERLSACRPKYHTRGVRSNSRSCSPRKYATGSAL